MTMLITSYKSHKALVWLDFKLFTHFHLSIFGLTSS
ncbi:hypothetical protein HCH_03553 [Hahella chejuensis KCTC 2396]|uniref:Uncharacterized protein n=1 Tax=Hahella chejuensis (strain KCTC 2396) TaxID=349521 RepID=Q2SGC9_HAHCH|nr:hypothetical protein HCH_03553 [Hahella chejuensis KCTC 2396]